MENNIQDIKALDELFEKSAQYRKSKEYYDLLNFINSFPSLSPFNAFLIHMQNRGVKIVMTRSQWLRRYGKKVKYQARPLVILVPFGPVEFVYDIADIEGYDDNIPKELINPFITSGNLNTSVYDLTLKHCEKENVIVNEYVMPKNSAGFATSKENDYFNVNINSSYGLNEKYSTLVHELGHIFCGHIGGNTISWWNIRRDISQEIMEIEAESISYIVCKRKGLNTSSESYLSNYITTNDKMPPISLDTILTVSLYIETMGTYKYKSKTKNK